MTIRNELIESCIKKDRASQKALYEILLPYLKTVAVRYTTNRSFIQDVLQESFVKIFQNLDRFSADKGSLEHWCSRITINTALNHNRKENRNSENSLDTTEHRIAVAPGILDQLSSEDILAFLRTMPPDFFEAFSLHVLDGFEHREIAEILNISEALSRKRVSRARQWIKTVFESDSVDETVNLHPRNH